MEIDPKALEAAKDAVREVRSWFNAHVVYTESARVEEIAKATITAYKRAREAQGYVEVCWQPMETAPHESNQEILIKGGQRWRDSDDYKERYPHTGPSLATYDKFRGAWCIGNEETLHECYWCENPTGWLDPRDLIAARPQKEG